MLATTTLDRFVRLLGLPLFFALLAAADRSLARWGSAAIRRKPRPGGRVTILLMGLVATCLSLAFVADKLWSAAPGASIAVFVAQFPAAIAVVLGLDRLLPDAGA